MSEPSSALFRATAFRPGIERILIDRAARIVPSTPPPQPPPAPPAAPPAPTAAGLPALPPATQVNPFASLPLRAPGDRIKSEDFNALTKGLQIIADAYTLAGALFGVPFGQTKAQLAAQLYEIDRVMTVFGTEVSAETDPSVDGRLVIYVVPTSLGARRVMIVVTEAVETRRLAPNLLNLSYADAVERQRAALGQGTFPAVSATAPPLVNRTVGDVLRILNP